MSKEMVISANLHETRVAIMEEGLLCEYYVEREKEFALVGSIYKGRVTRVLPGMQSSFVDIGLDSDAFLYVSDFLEGIEELDEHIAEDKVVKAPDHAEASPVAAGEVAAPFEPLPGETLSSAGASPALSEPSAIEPGNSIAAPPPSMSSASSGPSHSSDRGRFDNRGRAGRDFGRRGGRGGRGRFNRGGRGGGRGGDRRFGRDLPPSKYASHRPYDDSPAEPGAPEGHISVILPGESLARHKDKPIAEAAPPASENLTELVSSDEIHQSADRAAVEQYKQTHESSAPRPFEPRREFREHRSEHPSEHRSENRAEAPRSFSSGLEPLPGESLAKWKDRAPAAPAEPLAKAPVEASASSPIVELEPEVDADKPEVLGSDETSVAELSEDEAASLAEQVAEAQEELAERDAEERGFAAADNAAGAVHDAVEGEEHREMLEAAAEQDAIADAEDAAAEAQEAAEGVDDAELEEEENSAETEGMIAAAPESESEADAIAAEAAASIAEETAPAQEQQPWRAQVRDDQRARMQFPRRTGVTAIAAVVTTAGAVRSIAAAGTITAIITGMPSSAVRSSSRTCSSRARKSSSRSPRSRWARRARALPATSPYPAASSSTCPRSITPASRAKSPPPKSARVCVIW